MLNRRVTRELGAQCAHLAVDRRMQIHVDNTCYDVFVATLPDYFDALPSLSLGQIILDADESDRSLSRLLFIVCRLFGIGYVRVDAEMASPAELLVHNGDTHAIDNAHLAAVVCVVEVLGGSCRRSFRVVYLTEGETHTLHNLALYAYHNISVHSPRFDLLVIQLIETFRQFSERNVFPTFSPHRLRVDANLWLRIPLEDAFHPLAFASDDVDDVFVDASSRDDARLWSFTQRWCQRKLSNLDYILKLNEFTGRSRNDMTRPAVVPWVTDFTAEQGGLRPLDRTKYRLNKGDAQLHEQYRGQTPAYHLPELLSDIGWLVYRARVTPRDVLCRYVRSTWVPEEYPASVARLYIWTPDECIPDLYDDPAVFRSIHADMPDLELPTWTPTPAEFVRWHRGVLESDAVSERLHKWIDLAFGYLLTGDEAVDALNVHLSYVNPPDEPKRLRTHGAVKLFTRPHPRRLSSDACTDAFSIDSNRVATPPLAMIKAGSAVLSDESVVLMSTLKSVYQIHGQQARHSERSLLSVGVTIVELALADYCRDLSAHATFVDRQRRAQRLLHDKSHLLPRNLRLVLNLLLRVDCFSKICPTAAPLASLEDVSSLLCTFFTMPPNLSAAHALLSRYKAIERLERVSAAKTTSADSDRSVQQLARERIHILAQCLAFDELYDLWLNVFVDAVDVCARTSATVCHRLLSRVVELAIGEERCSARLIAVIRRLLDPPTKHTVKLLDRRFVLQLCVRFGSKVFFSAFLPSILEALLFVADEHDCTDMENADVADEETVRETAVDTTLWLAKRYGPFVTATQISSRLLSLLSVCYSIDVSQRSEMEKISLDMHVHGDVLCKRVANILVEISVIYGTAFIALQYIPYCADVIALVTRRLATSNGASPALESSVIGAVVALSAFCDALSDRQLMNHLQDLIVDGVLFPAVRLFSSANTTFSSTCLRRIFAVKTVSTLHLLALRVGTENVRRHLSSAVQRVFCTFNLVYDEIDVGSGGSHDNRVYVAENAPKQLAEIFTPDFARLLVTVFFAISGRQFLVGALPNASLVLAVAAAADHRSDDALPQLEDNSLVSSSQSIGKARESLSSFSSPSLRGASLELSASASILNGNRLAAFALGDDADNRSLPAILPNLMFQLNPSANYNENPIAASVKNNFDPEANFPALNQKMGTDNSATRLAGSWVDHFSAVLSRTNTSLAFNHILLATFRGHTDTIRRLCMLDNENSFVSASADRTLRLWSLRASSNNDDASNKVIAPQWTYVRHTKPVQDVILLTSIGCVASSDVNSVDIWDPFRGATIHQLDVHGAVGLAALDRGLLGIAANDASIVKTFDSRSSVWCHEMCAWLTKSTPVYIRAIAASPDGARKLAVALSNSSIAILDVRTGKILASFASIHSRVTQVKWLTDEMLAIIHAEHPTEIWTLAAAGADSSQLVDVCLTRRLSEIASALATWPCQLSSSRLGFGHYASHFRLTRNASVDMFGVGLQRSSSGKIPKPGSAIDTLIDDDVASATGRIIESDTPLTQFVTLVQSSSGNRLCLYSDARNGICTNVRLRADFAPGGVTSLECLPMNNMLLLGCANGIIRLAS